MATTTVTSLVSQVNDIQVDFLSDQAPAVSSLEVAKHFQKKHKHVLDEIRKMHSILPKSFHGLNFEPMQHEVSMDNGATRKSPYYLLTRDAFSLLVMGFTGSAALR